MLWNFFGCQGSLRASKQPEQQLFLVTDWQSLAVPRTIRRPWQVFHDDIQERNFNSQWRPAQALREKLNSVQTMGAMATFAALDLQEQHRYTEVSIKELSAYIKWRRTQIACSDQFLDEIAEMKLQGTWDSIHNSVKDDWVPENCRAVLMADMQFARLIADEGVLMGQNIELTA